ncbi:MAG: 2-hydroxyacid dehydrogenase, partial [Phycisphaerales bacterium]|nr:2-hydroxyacid dehydrogenase [Phycisphaerales bacterium]
MRIAVFGTKSYTSTYFDRANKAFGHELVYFEARLHERTARLAEGFPTVCAFVNDQIDAAVLRKLHSGGVRTIALRCAGFNNVDLEVAAQLGMQVVRVPAYSPESVAEHTVALLLALNRRIHRAFNRVREGNFALEGLVGFELRRRTVGVVGTGRIGAAVTKILNGFGCRILAYDIAEDPEVSASGVKYVELDELLKSSDIVTLHCPLVPATHHLIDAAAVDAMKNGVMLINTSRGALVDTPAVIEGLKSGRIGAVGLDVYEEEEALFFEDLSSKVLQDDVFARLLTFPNVVITGHQAFLTEEALTTIAETTLRNISQVERGEECENAVAFMAKAKPNAIRIPSLDVRLPREAL